MMEVVRTSETSVNFNVTTRRYIPEDSKLHVRSRENLKSHTVNLYAEATLRCTRPFIDLMMEAVRTSETSVNFNVTTRRYIPEDSKLNVRSRENLKSHTVNLYGEATLRCTRPFIDLMMEAVRTSETSVNFNETTRRYIPEDSKLH
jgi:hypothetical protein